MSVNNAVPAARGAPGLLCGRVRESWQGWRVPRGDPAPGCARGVQPSALAAPLLDARTGLYHSARPRSGCVAQIFPSCCPLSSIDNTWKAFYLLERPWLTRFTSAGGEHIYICMSPLRGLPRHFVGTQRWCFCQRCCLLYKRGKTL